MKWVPGTNLIYHYVFIKVFYSYISLLVLIQYSLGYGFLLLFLQLFWSRTRKNRRGVVAMAPSHSMSSNNNPFLLCYVYRCVHEHSASMNRCLPACCGSGKI